MDALFHNTFNTSFFRAYPFFDSDALVPSPVQHPFYHISSVSVVPGINDKALSLISPLVSYWALSFFFHLLDLDIFQWSAKYRIHESEEIKSKNLVSRKDVIIAVILQQVVQTVLGILWLDDSESDAFRNHTAEMRQLSKWVVRLTVTVLGEVKGKEFLAANGQQVLSWSYWWGVPIAQFLLAIFIIDTWQYFLHRAFHMNKTLYKRIHAVHHRLYVPYAYGALYNHPLEGFLFDTLGAAVAQQLTFMTIRQATVLFAISTLKTVDDHCGYALPWDPLQALFGNNADYHDIHHQAVGIKSNFSQPYFIHWDVLLGTRMTRKQLDVRRRKGKDKDTKVQ
ncbi:fatty acid hydroxylase superfamily-domain-containing protein [Gautieria morchelliformis]|nr:fatty acid hydroxylase superfamily-domain-containing protein [Gautieria morchelliformis]